MTKTLCTLRESLSKGLKMFGFCVIKRYKMRLQKHFCTVLAGSLLDFAADYFLCS